MPASSSLPGTGRSILLVEEYGALAVAIGSALKKFAPEHRTRVVATLAEAEAVAAELTPELLVIDFDPPQPGAVDFFNRMKAAYPGCRVLVIAAGSSSEVLQARHKPAAFTFVDKPFDLAALEMTVQQLLAPSHGSAPTDGTLRDLGLADVLPLLCPAGATTVLEVEGAGGRTGEIHLAFGQIVHAETDEQVGAAALAAMFRWRAVRFAEAERAPANARTIQPTWANALAEAIRKSNVSRAKAKSKPPTVASTTTTPAKKLVIIDDTELLLIFVEDILATADANWDIITASTGVEGVERVIATLPDAVLLDFSLPDITGDEVCRRLLANKETADIPIVMMSGHVPEMTATAARFDNVIATIAKPFLSHALVDLVRKTLTAPAPRRHRVEIPGAPAAVPPPASTAPPLQPEAPPTAPAAPPEQPPKPQAERAENGHRAAKPEPPRAPIESASPPAVVERPAELPRSDTITIPPERPAAPPKVPSPVRKTILQPTNAPALAQSRAPSELAPPLTAPRRAPEPISTRVREISEVTSSGNVAPVRIPTATSNAVVLGLALEVVSMQFTPSLQMGAIRARLWSRTVSLHIHPQALPGVALPEAGFELGRIDLDTRGHMDTVRLTPTNGRPAKPPLRDAVPVGGVAVLPANGGSAVQLTPAMVAPMTMQLFASFDLAGVELSPTFGIGAVVLKSRGADLRVTLSPAGPSTGATFRNAQVLLDRSSRIAEILLDSVA